MLISVSEDGNGKSLLIGVIAGVGIVIAGLIGAFAIAPGRRKHADPSLSSPGKRRPRTLIGAGISQLEGGTNPHYNGPGEHHPGHF